MRYPEEIWSEVGTPPEEMYSYKERKSTIYRDTAMQLLEEWQAENPRYHPADKGLAIMW